MNILIINIGPYGDVLRTTILLNEFIGHKVYWLTSIKNKDILVSELIYKKFYIENILSDYYTIYYDIVISLNEEYPFKYDVKCNKLIGIDKNKEYTNDSSYWFDMSLSSKYGKEKANELKMKNRKTYNQIIIEMVGGNWAEQDYVFPFNKVESNKIGLIDSVSGIWKSKKWNGFNKLYELLKSDGLNVSFLQRKLTLKEHINDLNDCNLIICPDTFGMHLGIALKKKVISLFNSTSPYEIYDYGRLYKIVSPVYEKFFYSKEYDENLSNSIDVELVYKKIKEIL
jgi:heptosyltransferase-2